MKNISDVSFLEWWKSAYKSFSAVLFDIDGTLIAGDKAMPGASKTLQWLRENNFPFFTLTNDGNHSLIEKSGFLNKAGLNIKPSEIVSCGSALKGFVEKHGLEGHKAFIMGDLGEPCYAIEAGLKPVRDIKSIDECSFIIVGEGVYDWHSNISAVLNSAVRMPRRKIVVPNPDSYWPDGKGGFGIGAGGKARFIQTLLDEMEVQAEIIYLGKPYRPVFDYSLNLLQKRYFGGVSPSAGNIVMLGDNLQSDIRGASERGFTSILLLSGVTPPGQAFAASGNLKPDYIFERL